MRRLLDTNILIDALRGEPHVAARLAGAVEAPLVSAVSVEELLFGMRPGEEAATERMLAGLELVPVGEEEARLSARWRHELRAQGRTLSRPDSLIAACAFTAEAVLVTTDRRGFPMPELTVEDWPRG